MRVLVYWKALLVGLCVFCFGSCVKVPYRDGAAQVDVNEVIKRVKCDLFNVVLRKANKQFSNGARPFLFLRSWAAKIHLTVVVDDSISLNPGASVTTPLRTINNVSQTFTLGVGAGVTTQAVRTEDIDFLVSFSDIQTEFNQGEMNGPNYDFCRVLPGLLLESDLGLESLLDSALKPVETGILYPGKNIGPNSGPPPAIPKVDLPRLAVTPSPKVNSAAKADLPGTLEDVIAKAPKTDLQAKSIMNKLNIPLDLSRVPSANILGDNTKHIADLERIKKIVANSVEATAVETKTQAIINNIVKPRYGIALASLDGSCLGPVTKHQFDAIALSANVSSHVVEADKASDEKGSDAALNATNAARDEVIKATNRMAAAMQDCADQTTAIDKAKPLPVPAKYDPVNLISETVSFYITSTGSVTPAWKLVRVTAPLAGTFLSGQRKDTNTLILTLGRPVPGPNGTQASPAMDTQVLSAILREALINNRP